MPNGYWNRILFVDLSARRVQIESLPESVYRETLGGYGLGVRVLTERMPAGADPLGPDNILGFLPGLPTAFTLPGRERGDPPQDAGPVAGVTLDMEAMAAGYFETLGGE